MEDKAYSAGEMTKDVPYLTVEGIQARNSSIIHKLIRIIIILIIGIILNNALWIYMYNQYNYADSTTTETTTTDYSQDGTGNNIIGDNNEVGYEPKTDSDQNPNNPNENTNTPDR